MTCSIWTWYYYFMKGSETGPPEEISEIHPSGFPIETPTQAQERRDRAELNELREKYGGMTGTTTNIVRALHHESLAAFERGEDTSERDEMLGFLRIEFAIETEKQHKTGAISLDELGDKIEQKRKHYQPTDPRNETADKVQALIEQTKKDVERGKVLFKKAQEKGTAQHENYKKQHAQNT